MKKIILLLMLIAATITTSAQQTSLVIDNQTPGWLSSKINYEDQQTLVNLTVTGVLNKTDLEFINKLMNTYSLKGKLDLSDAEIVELGYSNPWGILHGRLKHFLFPKDLKEIHDALEYVSVDTVTIGGFAMKTITPSCFDQDAYVRHLIIREGVDSIKPSAPSFQYCLESVHLPSTLKVIGPEVGDGQYYSHNHCPGLFEGCTKLTEINLPDSIEYFQDRSFMDTPAFADTVRLPKHLKEYYMTTFGEFKNKGTQYDFYNNWTMCVRDKQVVYISDSVAKIHFNVPDTYMELHISKKKPIKISSLGNGNGYKKIHVYVPKSSLNDYLQSNWSGFTLLAEPNPATIITIDSDTLHVQKDHTKGLNVKILPIDADSKDIIWNIKDVNVAKVSQEGFVTGIHTGETLLYVTLKDNPELKDSCIIKVFQPVSSISLNLTEKEIKVGEDFKLIASISPDDADDKGILWTSENDLIATVEDGLVTGKKAGKIKITAISHYDNTISTDCYVRVLQPVEGISLDKTSLELNKIGESIQLLATIIPDDANNKSINWKSSDEKVCIVSNGKVVAVGFGTAVVIATTVDGGFMATCSVTVENTTGIEDLQEKKSAKYSIFTVDGKHIESLQKGINLIRFDNGQTKKVTVK